MPELIRGETSDCSNPKLDIFTKVSGVPANVSSLSFQILEKVTTPGSPIQTFPVVAGDKSSVDVSTLCPSGGKIATGHYHATYTVPLSEAIGLHEIRWFFKLTPADIEQTISEEFSVLASAKASPGIDIISVSDVRAAGVNVDPPSDADIQLAICLWQAFIERATRQWFTPIELELTVDGTDSDALHFGVPIISIEELRINNEETALATDKYKVYNATRYPKDKQNPRIKLVDRFQDRRDIYTAPIRHGSTLFRKGRQNQFIKGVFGCVEADGSPPLLIQRALLKLVIEKLTIPIIPGTGPAVPPPILTGVILEEKVDVHSIKYAQKGSTLNPRAPGLAGITEDQEILGIIRLYKAPIGLASPANPSYR